MVLEEHIPMAVTHRMHGEMVVWPHLHEPSSPTQVSGASHSQAEREYDCRNRCVNVRTDQIKG